MNIDIQYKSVDLTVHTDVHVRDVLTIDDGGGTHRVVYMLRTPDQAPSGLEWATPVGGVSYQPVAVTDPSGPTKSRFVGTGAAIASPNLDFALRDTEWDSYFDLVALSDFANAIQWAQQVREGTKPYPPTGTADIPLQLTYLQHRLYYSPNDSKNDGSGFVLGVALPVFHPDNYTRFGGTPPALRTGYPRRDPWVHIVTEPPGGHAGWDGP